MASKKAYELTPDNITGILYSLGKLNEGGYKEDFDQAENIVRRSTIGRIGAAVRNKEILPGHLRKDGSIDLEKRSLFLKERQITKDPIKYILGSHHFSQRSRVWREAYPNVTTQISQKEVPSQVIGIDKLMEKGPDRWFSNKIPRLVGRVAAGLALVISANAAIKYNNEGRQQSSVVYAGGGADLGGPSMPTEPNNPTEPDNPSPNAHPKPTVQPTPEPTSTPRPIETPSSTPTPIRGPVTFPIPIIIETPTSIPRPTETATPTEQVPPQVKLIPPVIVIATPVIIEPLPVPLITSTIVDQPHVGIPDKEQPPAQSYNPGKLPPEVVPPNIGQPPLSSTEQVPPPSKLIPPVMEVLPPEIGKPSTLPNAGDLLNEATKAAALLGSALVTAGIYLRRRVI